MPGERLCRWIRLALIVLACFPAISGAGTAMNYGDVVVIAEDGPDGSVTHGYTEYRVLVRNRSVTAAHIVTLTMPSHSFNPYRVMILGALTRTVEIGPESSVQVSLYMPAFPMVGGSGLAVSIDGRRQDEVIQLKLASSVWSGYPPGHPGRHSSSLKELHRPLVLLGRSVPANFADKANPAQPVASLPGGAPVPGLPALPSAIVPVPAARPAGGGATATPSIPGGAPVPGLSAEFVKADVAANWSSSWLSYSRYDGVVVTSEDLAALTAAARIALFQYVECGGVLLILGKARVPESWGRQPDNQGLQSYAAGFGRALVHEPAQFDSWRDQWQLLQSTWRETSQPFARRASTSEAHQQFPVVEDISVPVRGLLVVMLAFVILIGPVNLLFLSRIKRRLWMFWTVPLMSFLTCATVFGYMILAEGWAGHLRTTSLTVLDEATHRSATLGWTAFYSPLTPRGGLHFSPDTELTLHAGGDAHHANSTGSECRLDWTAGQHLASGWISPRVPAHFLVRKNEVRRERVALRRGADGNLAIVNGLGSTIVKFWYKDERGTVLAATNVAAGAEAMLGPAELPGSSPEQDVTGDLRKTYCGNWLTSIDVISKNPTKLLRHRTYVAVLDDAPFVEDGLRGVQSRKCNAVVIGINKEADKE